MTLPKKGLKTRPYNIGMEKRDLKIRPYNIDMENKDLKKLTKGQLIKLLMNQRKNEEVESVKPKPVLRNSVSEQFQDDRPLQMQNARRPPKPSREPPLPPTPKHEFNFDDDIFQTGNQSFEKFKIIGVQNRENKKF